LREPRATAKTGNDRLHEVINSKLVLKFLKGQSGYRPGEGIVAWPKQSASKTYTDSEVTGYEGKGRVNP
jgi:hypothetical protein